MVLPLVVGAIGTVAMLVVGIVILAH
jgi:hypothetical protein